MPRRLSNAVTMAMRRRLILRLVIDPERAVLTVEDDGRGFAPTRTPDRFGLVGLGERVRLLGGKLDIETAPGVGAASQPRCR